MELSVKLALPVPLTQDSWQEQRAKEDSAFGRSRSYLEYKDPALGISELPTV